jgi:arginine exporter protein ArgO
MTEIEVLRKSVRRWKTFAIVSWVGIASMFLLFMVVAGIASAAANREQQRAMEAEQAARQAMHEMLQQQGKQK